jgi:hypothetical protein
MQRKTIVAIVVGAVALGGAWLAVQAAQPGDEGSWRPGMMWQAHGGRHWGGGAWGGPHGGFCAAARSERVEDMLGMVESFVTFTPEQAPAWAGLRDAVRAGSQRFDATCASLREAGEPGDPPARLARLELMLSAGLETLREVRPAFDAFYATLDERQKAAIDRLIAHRGRG